MAHVMLRAALLAGATVIVLPAFAQEKAPDLVITPNRLPMSIQEIGSSVTVITQADIEKEGSKSLRDVLSGQPGVETAETGGPGGFVSVFLRGAEARHTLILVDGVRYNDPTSTGNETDLSLIPPQMVERIEIVRGPQSALYGSDAIGGVINIITKRGRKGPPVWRLRAEGGSYGTFSSQMSVAGATEDTVYSFGLNQFHSDGFKRYGYRVPRLAYLDTNGSDPTNRYGAYGNISKRVNDWLTIQAGIQGSWTKIQFDGADLSPLAPFLPNFQTASGFSAYQKAIAENGPFRTTLSTFETRIVKKTSVHDLYEDFFTGLPTNFDATYAYRGLRLGAELQEDVDLGQYGKVTVGARHEQEKADSNSGDLGKQSTQSAYALYQVSPLPQLHLSLGGRIDRVSTFGSFATYRATSSYDLTPTTRVHASYGTGAKAPSLYQLLDPLYGNPDLKPETSRGYDIGVEQTFLDGDARAGVTWFSNRYSQLIDWRATGLFTGQYFNLNGARTSGVEVTGEYNFMPSFARLKLAYTHLDSRGETLDVTSIDYNKPLLRRPRDSARVSVVFTPTRELSIEPMVRFISSRADKAYDPIIGDSVRVTLKAYTRFDMLADYKVNRNVSVFARGENLTNVKYEDVYNYGTAGRSVYAGVQMTW
jgi:vitamin B12 transporter